MTCQIKINDVHGTLPPGATSPISITVIGTAVECPSGMIVVKLTCPPQSVEMTVPIMSGGNWVAEFQNVADLGCRCEGAAEALAFCEGMESSCSSVPLDTGGLKCDLPPPCPTVTLSVTVPGQGCAGSGRSVTAQFTATLAPPLPGCSFSWAFGDGTTNPPPTNTLTTSHTYTLPGTYSAAVSATCPGSCPTDLATVTVAVPRCCPVVTEITSTLQDNECADGTSHSATLAFTADTDPPSAAGTYTWDFGDGSSSGPNPGPNTSHSYTTPGMHTVHVAYTPDSSVFPDCPFLNQTEVISVPTCPGGPSPSGGDDEGGFCGALRRIMTIAAILAVLALLIAACVPAVATILFWIAAGLGVIAGIAGAIWGVFCPKPCKWGLLLAWQVALGVGVGALYFTGCCPWLWFVGLPLIGAAIALFVEWSRGCNKNRCQQLAELSIAISGVILPLLGWIGAISGLSACINQPVAAALSSFAAAIVIALASCASQRATSGQRQ